MRGEALTMVQNSNGDPVPVSKAIHAIQLQIQQLNITDVLQGNAIAFISYINISGSIYCYSVGLSETRSRNVGINCIFSQFTQANSRKVLPCT